MAQDTSTLSRILACESNVRRIITQQEENGVQFNSRKAHWFVYVLEERKVQLYKRIRPCLSMEVIEPFSVPVNKPFLKTGAYNKSVIDWYSEGEIPDIAGRFTRVIFEEPDLGSRKKLQAQLLRLGWKPRSFTEKGNPKLTIKGEICPSLYEIVDKVGKDIADWYVFSHRQSQIKGWIRRLRPDGRIPAEAITIGTPTFRFTHSGVVNVPKASKYVVFGKEMRSLFTAYKGEVLVGHDASGLELRMLAHYINDAEYTKVVTEGDPHTYHQKLAKLQSRDQAKTFIYGFNYGAGDLLVGIGVDNNLDRLAEQYTPQQIAKCIRTLKKRCNDYNMIGIGNNSFVPVSKELALRSLDGNNIKTTFLKYNPKLEGLIKRVQKAAGRGHLIGLDGRTIHMRRFNGKVQVHKALNTLLQTAGAVVMKYSMIFLDDWISREGLRSTKVIDMHDEGQYSVHPDDVQRHKELAVQSIVKAGEFLNLRIPLSGEAKSGDNWATTH